MPQHDVRSVRDITIPIPVFRETANASVYDSTHNIAHRSPIICFSHLRWDFVYQRPQHLMSRFSKDRQVYFFEEPVHHDGPPSLSFSPRGTGVQVITPQLPFGSSPQIQDRLLRQLTEQFILDASITDFVAWYYTPMAITWTKTLRPSVVVYDCMDELSLFRNAPPMLVEREGQLMKAADLVFTGGASLYEAKQGRHSAVHLFPSSIDVGHFHPARKSQPDPIDQREIPTPRLGFFGVIDERMDLQLLDAIASARPDWHIVMVGPVVKIDPTQLPHRSNIHYLGQKPYAELPGYIAGWDVAIMPFALNESTRFISPTKTPEYMAAGRPVVSTPIRDVTRPYGEAALVRIASTPDEFVEAVEAALAETPEERRRWLYRVDGFLSTTSWDRTWNDMANLIAQAHSASQHTDTSNLRERVQETQPLGAVYGV